MAATCLANSLAKCALGVEPGADRGAALGQRIELLQAACEPRDAGFHLGRVAGKFLAERERRGVLGMGAADLDDRRERLGLGLERRCKCASAGSSRCGDLLRRRDMHGGRESCRSTTGSY